MVRDLDSQVNPGRVNPANCDELFERGQTESGNYLIQPSMEVAPFEVYCDFDVDKVMTVIKHNKKEKQITATLGKPDGCEVKI